MNREAYRGALVPVLDVIIDGYQRGKTTGQIVRALRRDFGQQPRPHWFRSVHGYGVRYALKRIGATRMEDRSNLGRPLDMGGPRDVWIERTPWEPWR